jgi:hypothetical protein
MMSESIVKAALTDTQHLELRMLDLKGKSEPFPAFVETASREA